MGEMLLDPVLYCRIDNLEFQEINWKDLKFLKENEVHNHMYSNVKQKTASEDISVLQLPAEGESYKQSDDKFVVSSSKNVVAARLILLDEIKQIKAADEETLAETMKQGRSDLFDSKMVKSSSANIALKRGTKIVLKVQASLPREQNDKLSSQQTQVDSRKLEPEWLDTFCNRDFFEACPKHPICRNDMNKFCIDCDRSLCQYCVSVASHAKHRVVKIYRHVYKSVVPLAEMGRHIDCSLIQPYRCNRQPVIALTPLPHCGSKASEEVNCRTCRRKLIDSKTYNYCSILCKVEAFMKKQKDIAPAFVKTQKEIAPAFMMKQKDIASPLLLLDQMKDNAEQKPMPNMTRKRKGVPHRAPLS